MTWVTLFISLSQICGIHPADIEAVVRVESNYCKYTVSKSSTAEGCFQLLKVNRSPSDDHTNVYISALRGVEYLCKLKKSYPKSYLVRYHVGPNGDINSKKALIYKSKLNINNNQFIRSY